MGDPALLRQHVGRVVAVEEQAHLRPPVATGRETAEEDPYSQGRSPFHPMNPIITSCANSALKSIKASRANATRLTPHLPSHYIRSCTPTRPLPRPDLSAGRVSWAPSRPATG